MQLPQTIFTGKHRAFHTDLLRIATLQHTAPDTNAYIKDALQNENIGKAQNGQENEIRIKIPA